MSDPVPVPRLTNRQRVFVEHYLRCWNATEAARQAGYSEHTANQQGPRLLVNAGVKAAIAERLKDLQATTDEVKARLTEHSRGSMADFLNESNGLDLQQARDRGKLQLIRKLKRTTRTEEEATVTTVEFELYDAQAATVQLGRALGLFVDRQEVTGKNGGPIEFAEIKARLLSRFAEGDAAGGADGPPGEPVR